MNAVFLDVRSLPLLVALVVLGNGLSPKVWGACEDLFVIPCAPCKDSCEKRHACNRVRRVCPSTGVRVAPGLPRVVGVVTERLTLQNEWVEVPRGEVHWSHDQLRYAPVLDSSDASQIRRVRMLMRPWDDPDAPWKEFARSRPGERWAYGKPNVGIWAITIEVQFAHGLPVWFLKTSDE